MLKRCNVLRVLATVEAGQRFDEQWSMTFVDRANPLVKKSPWHHIPLQRSSHSTSRSSVHVDTGITYSFVNEIPKGQRAKLEVATKQEFNPIIQDRVKKTGALRNFTYGDIPFNYGCFPQTWEDPSITDPNTECKGDGDPVDVVELTGASLAVGSITPVRILGVLGLIDEGETDWKILTVAHSHEWKQLTDVPTSVLDGVIHWFRYYKTTDGKPENQFAFDGKIQSESVALEVVEECHSQYRNLISGHTPNPGLWLPK